jgi:hypothetical protein
LFLAIGHQRNTLILQRGIEPKLLPLKRKPVVDTQVKLGIHADSTIVRNTQAHTLAAIILMLEFLDGADNL